MTWREFELKRAGFKRQQIREWERTREIVYYALLSTGALDPKKTSKEKFMPLGGGQEQPRRMTERQREAMRVEREKAKKEQEKWHQN